MGMTTLTRAEVYEKYADQLVRFATGIVGPSGPQPQSSLVRCSTDTAHAADFAAAENEARDAGLCVWGERIDTSPPPCDTSYSTVCIPPPPPDLDCGDVTYRNFKVLPPDPHRFDGDKDGVGWET